MNVAKGSDSPLPNKALRKLEVVRVSLKLNVIANYVGQAYVAGINVALLPAQVRLLGPEAYGLVGFFTMLSAWLQLLDVGLSPTLARETATYRAGSLDAGQYHSLLGGIERIFLSCGVAITIGVYLLSGPIAHHWLRTTGAVPPATVAQAVAVMGLVFSLRWQATLSRSVLIGLEKQVWVNALNVLFATLRSLGVLAVMIWLGATPRVFFMYQAVVAALELAMLRTVARKALALESGVSGRISLAPLRKVAQFSVTVAIASAIWISVTQLDSLLLSKFLPLSEYAWFSIAVMAASSINLVAAPIAQAVQPRLTYFFATSNQLAFRRTYADSTQLLSAIALTASGTVALAARPLLWSWTGNIELADRTAPVLAFYAVGNGLLAVVAMTYYLQVARGDLSLHLRGNIAFAGLHLPLIVFATIHFGMRGAAVAWCVANFVFLGLWSLIVHRRFLPGAHARWLLLDVGGPAAVGAIPSLLSLLLPWAALTRFQTACVLVALGAVSVGSASLATSPVRRILLHRRTLAVKGLQ